MGLAIGGLGVFATNSLVLQRSIRNLPPHNSLLVTVRVDFIGNYAQDRDVRIRVDNEVFIITPPTRNVFAVRLLHGCATCDLSQYMCVLP